jgi:hypothetical protein
MTFAKNIAEAVAKKVTKEVLKKVSENPTGKTQTGQRPEPVDMEPQRDSLVGLLNR